MAKQLINKAGRLPVMSVHDAPLFVDLKIFIPAVAYTIFSSVGWAAISLTLKLLGLVMVFHTTEPALALILSERYKTEPEPEPLKIYIMFELAADCSKTRIRSVPEKALIAVQLTAAFGVARTLLLRQTS